MIDLKGEWAAVLKSKTFALVSAYELTTCGIFASEVFDGTKHLDLATIKLFIISQAIGGVAVALRHTLAGIEAKVEAAASAILGPDAVKQIEQAAQQRALDILAKKNPTAAAMIKDQLSKTEGV